MASIYGVEIKNFKELKDGSCNGIVYVDGKRIGEWERKQNDLTSDLYSFNINILEERAKKYLEKEDLLVTEKFMSELLDLTRDEIEYKALEKEGMNTFVQVTDGKNCWGYSSIMEKEEVLSSLYHLDFMRDCIKEAENDLSVKIYSDISDFHIKKPRDVENIRETVKLSR